MIDMAILIADNVRAMCMNTMKSKLACSKPCSASLPDLIGGLSSFSKKLGSWR